MGDTRERFHRAATAIDSEQQHEPEVRMALIVTAEALMLLPEHVAYSLMIQAVDDPLATE